MPISPLEGRALKETRKVSPHRRERPAWVTWIALCVGVFFTGTGVVLLLWGMSWQSWTISPRSVGEEGLVGGPVILPLGVFCLVLGIMWLFQGWTGFRRPGEGPQTTVCTHCGRRVEEDLDFCYHCMKRLQGPAGPSMPGVKGRAGSDAGHRRLELEDLEGGLGGRRK